MTLVPTPVPADLVPLVQDIALGDRPDDAGSLFWPFAGQTIDEGHIPSREKEDWKIWIKKYAQSLLGDTACWEGWSSPYCP